MSKSTIAKKYLTLTEAAKIIPGRPAVVTVKRWAYNGYGDIKLRTYKCGRRRFTTLDAIEDFVHQQTALDNGTAACNHAEAEAKLDKLGV